MVDTHPRIVEFYFIRHAPVIKRSGHLPPHDPNIADGPYQLAPLIASLPAGADWHISPLQRTRQTAALLTPELAPHSETIDAGLVEMNFGQWDDQPVAEVWQELATGPKHNWSFITPDITPPGGESFREQCDRISKWMDTVAATVFVAAETRPQIVVTHSGVLRAVIRHIMQCDAELTIGIPITHFGCLELTLMEPSRAVDAGGPWQLAGLLPYDAQPRTATDQ